MIEPKVIVLAVVNNDIKLVLNSSSLLHLFSLIHIGAQLIGKYYIGSLCLIQSVFLSSLSLAKNPVQITLICNQKL